MLNLPKLSIIVPNYNQGNYIEETLLSIINQNYPNLELIVIDGGSTDNSVEVIKNYDEHIYYWVSEKDSGQSDAINKGFQKATGDYIAWMNSDDLYYKDAFVKIFSDKGIDNYDFIFGPVCTGSNPLHASYVNSKKNQQLTVFNLLHFFYSTDYMIPSQSVFVRRQFLIENKIQFLNKDYHYCMDMEWYCRIAMCAPKYLKYNIPVSFFRVHQLTKTSSGYNYMQQEAIQILLNYRRHLSRAQQSKLFNRLFLRRLLKRFYKNPSCITFLKLLRIFLKIPVETVHDKQFLGLMKKSVLNIIN